MIPNDTRGVAHADSAGIRGRINLVPDTPSPTPDYWCTWGSQNYAVDQATAQNAFSHSDLANQLTEAHVFGANGWADAFDGARRDLYIVFDVGWDVLAGTSFDKAHWKLGSQIVAVDKFPTCSGTPVQRLRKLDELARKAGWKGAGLWIAAQAYQDGKDGKLLPEAEVESYLRERLRWSQQAGIHYWKIDYGARSNAAFRALVTRLAAQEAPDLVIENARGSCPLNDVRCPYEEKLASHKTGEFGRWGDGSVLRQSAEIARFSPVFRTYDVTWWFSTATTLDRVASLLNSLQADRSARGILNCEDEPYIAAALGLSMGVMRNPHWLTNEQVGSAYDARDFRQRSDEVIRAAHWHRIAPAFSEGGTTVAVDPQRLDDVWVVRKGDTWADWVVGQNVVQGAPARVSRGLDLPNVSGDERPYVIASRNPNGATAIATLPRLAAGRGFYFPRADVALSVPDMSHPIGIFGHYRSLTLKAPGHARIRRVYAQDLAAAQARDITSLVSLSAGEIVIPGSVIDAVGTSAAHHGDVSDPGLVLRVEVEPPQATSGHGPESRRSSVSGSGGVPSSGKARWSRL